MNILSPSILTADFWELGRLVECLKQEGVSMLHYDVMDGSFVPSISFGLPVLKSLRKKTDLFLDVHLMIDDPLRYIDDFVTAGADGLTVHAESSGDIAGSLTRIKERGKKAGIAINPSTPISRVFPFLEQVDMILVMSVNPGFGGQKLIPECLDKIRELKAVLDSKGLKKDIQIDGGVNRENIFDILSAGANVVVAGSAVVGENVRENVRYFLNSMN